MAKHKIAVISICSILLLAMVVAVTVNFKNNDDSDSTDSTETKNAVKTSTSTKAIKDICRPTDYKMTCEKHLTSEAGNTTDPKELIKAAFKVTDKEIRDVLMKSTLIQNAAKDPTTDDAFKICEEVLKDAIDDLYRSFEKFNISDIQKWDDYAYDLKIWLSGTVAMQETCLDGFEKTEGDTGEKMAQLLQTSRELTVNALAIINELSKAYESLTAGSKRRLLAVDALPEISYQNHLCNMFTMFCSKNPEDPFLTTKRRLLSDETLSKESVDGRRELSENNNPFDKMFDFFSDNKSSDDVVDETVYRRRNLHEAPAGAPAATPVGVPAAPSGAPPSGAPTAPTAAPSGPPAAPAGAPTAPTAAPAGAPSALTAAPSGAPAAPSGAPAAPAGIPDKSHPTAIVAQDGSGNYTSIAEALNGVPIKNSKPYVIYVKAGVYKEYVRINNTMTNVVFIGDGPTQTKITGNKSVILDGLKTYHTATVGVDGFGFTARDIGFENTAGVGGEQAVALRVSSDQAVFYNCQIDGYQDTLYSHAHRQFYRDCTITGTIDFIFGDAAAVFQNCTIVVRKPAANQACMVTAQGRKFDSEATGFVLQNCVITADADYLAAAASFKSFLGRPWKDFAKTFVFHSKIDSVIQPQGWEPWPPNLYIDTCWYSEYENTGPSAAVSQRVAWKGIKHVTKEEAESFTPGKFLRGDEWIPSTGVPYNAGIMPHAA